MFFPQVKEDYEIFKADIFVYKTRLTVQQEANEKLKKEIEELKKKPEVSLADLMRDNLGLAVLDFNTVKEDGIPPHFLDTDKKDLRELYINQLAQIYQLEVFHAMCKNHIDTQGNYSFRNADGDLQMLAGRMSVNGIRLIQKDVEKGFIEYQEGRKPPEEFDEFETTEGIIIKDR